MNDELKADYCIVGAGIAGLLVASRVARTGRKVLVLDQGPNVTEQERAALLAKVREEFDRNVDYNDELGETIRTPTAGESAGRLFGTGGTALHFGGWMVRPVEQDFRVKTRFGYGRDWPISYEQLEPWLVGAELETGVAGNADNPYASPRSRSFPLQAHAFSWFDRTHLGPALAKLGMKGHSGPWAVATEPYEQDYGTRNSCQGCRYCTFCPTGARYSPDRVHGAWLKKQGNVEIRNGVSLRRLEIEASPRGARISAGHAKTVDGREDIVVRAKHFVLAMGGIATPRMLLLSKGSGVHSQGLGNTIGQVGSGFSDHLQPKAFLELPFHAGGMLGFPTMQCDHGRQQVDRHEEPSWILIGPPIRPAVSDLAVQWATEGGRLSLSRLREAMPRTVDVWLMSEMSGTGRLSLDPNEKDAFGDPVTHIDLPFTAWDRACGESFERLATRLAEQLGARNTTIGDPECFYLHPSGATAMGTSPEDGVCDRDLKVFGVENLYLCSSSVFPHLGAQPPTLTIAALALRLGAHLEGK